MNAIQKLIKGIDEKTRNNEHITELEWLLDIAYKNTGIDKGTIDKAAAELQAKDAEIAALKTERGAVIALVNEWRYLAENKPMSPIKTNMYESCADELEAALKD